MAHNWQNWKSTFPSSFCHNIYWKEAGGLKNSNYTLKITPFVKSPSVTQRSVSQENAFKKSKNPSPFFFAKL